MGCARRILLAGFVVLAFGRASGPARAEGWRTLEPGLDLGEFAAPKPADAGDSTIRIVRLDPARYQLRLLNASAEATPRLRTAKGWAEHAGLAVAINASMYATDHRTSVSLMVAPGHVNNARLSKDNTVLAFGPLAAGEPPVRLVDRTCDDWGALRPRYGTLVQSIRMVSCDRRNTWSRREDQRWSIAAIGLDGAGRPLFVHCRSPYPVADLVEMLLALPIDLRRAMYVEGGPPAQLYVRGGGEEHEWVGAFDTGLFDASVTLAAEPLPNVIGAVRR